MGRRGESPLAALLKYFVNDIDFSFLSPYNDGMSVAPELYILLHGNRQE